jgi:hypothetical protein
MGTVLSPSPYTPCKHAPFDKLLVNTVRVEIPLPIIAYACGMGVTVFSAFQTIEARANAEFGP